MNNEFCIFKNLKRQAFDLSFFLKFQFMGLLTILKKIKQKEKEMRILLLYLYISEYNY